MLYYSFSLSFFICSYADSCSFLDFSNWASFLFFKISIIASWGVFFYSSSGFLGGFCFFFLFLFFTGGLTLLSSLSLNSIMMHVILSVPTPLYPTDGAQLISNIISVRVDRPQYSADSIVSTINSCNSSGSLHLAPAFSWNFLKSKLASALSALAD